MKNKKLIIYEISGVAVTMLLAVFFLNGYELLNKSIAGILIGAVNDSIWESGKCLWLGYIFYGLFELVTARPYFKQFVVAKFAGLYIVVLSYIALRSLFSPVFSHRTNLIISFMALTLGFFVSYKLTVIDYPLKSLFPTACFMILLLFLISFSFTAFPPQGMLFQDPVTGMYGIVPDYVDVGAIIMDKLFF